VPVGQLIPLVSDGGRFPDTFSQIATLTAQAITALEHDLGITVSVGNVDARRKQLRIFVAGRVSILREAG
jgi:hypothetical protein